MSEKISEKTTKETKSEELVWYEAPLMPGVSQDIIAAVNGKYIRVKRGERVQIHPKYVEALDNASRQKNAAYRAATEAQKTKKLYDM